MATPQLQTLMRHLEQLSGGPCELPGTDRQLLEDFSARGDEMAFAELVARHGPMVLRVCRRVLHHEQDAEDAFQATFLVLARCLGSIRKREALADWLHGVAYRTAMNAKRSAARRRNHEARLREQTAAPTARPTWDDVQAILDEEIQRLPETFRSAFVLCVLEGKTIAAAAAELQCKEGTVATRVMRARQRLQNQLARRGIKLAALLAALCMAEGVVRAVPVRLSQMVIRNGLLVAAGGTAAGVISPHVAALATGVARAMFLQKTKIATIVLLAVGLVMAGAGLLAHQALKAEEKTTAQPAVKPSTEPIKPAVETIEVAGRVLDPDGKPVARARLYRPHSVSDDEGDLSALGTTDAEGRFRVKLPRPSDSSKQTVQRLVAPGGAGGGAGGGGMSLPGATLPRPTGATLHSLVILAVADGLGLNWTELPPDKAPGEVTVRLVKDLAVHGRLLDTEGHPVAGVTVTVKGVGGPTTDILDVLEGVGRPPQSMRTLMVPLNKMLRVTATDKDGRFEITGAGADRVALFGVNSDTTVLPNSLVAIQEGFDPKKIKLGPRPGNAQLFGPSFECVVLPSRLVEGTVREAGSGKPAVGAEVTGYAGQQTAKAVTDDKGHYRLVGLPKVKQYRVQVVPAHDAPLLASRADATDRPGLELVTCDVELLRGVLVQGRITDKATGKGVASQVSCALLPDNKFAEKLAELHSHLQPVFTDGEGNYSLVTLPGPSLLMVHSVADANPINGIGINPYKGAELDEADRKRVKMDKKTDDGVHVIALAGKGTTALERINAVKVLDLEKDAGPGIANLTLDPGKTLTIRLQDSDGKPLSGARAFGLSAVANPVVTLKDDACPVFALDPERPRRLAFMDAERKLVGFVTVRGDEKEPPTVRLTALAVITGRVLDSDGRPLGGVTVVPRYPDSAAQIMFGRLGRDPGGPLTDKEGRFRLRIAPEVKVPFLYFRGDSVELIEEKQTDREPLKPGATRDLGDLRVKPRPRPE